jgi:hypothetical protein
MVALDIACATNFTCFDGDAGALWNVEGEIDTRKAWAIQQSADEC